MDTLLKIGTRVQRKNGELFSSGLRVDTVKGYGLDTLGPGPHRRCYLTSTGTWIDPTLLELAPANSEDGVTTPTGDIITKPQHYTRWPIEPIAFIMRNNFEFWRGNIVKYVSRAGYKLYDGQSETESEITDLKKVIRYAEMRINQLQGETTL